MDKNTNELIEKLSSKVHDAWWEEKKRQGFHPPSNHEGDGKYNPACDKFYKTCNRCHTDMYPYDELPEHVKEYDRVTVRAILKAIDELGIKLV
jgi:hypothetical protein